LDGIEEINWVRASQQGDRQAFSRLVEKYSRIVFAMCLSSVGHAQDADDLAQEVFMKAFVQINSLRQADRFGPWLTRICRNTATDFLRSRRRPEPLLPDQMESVPSPTRGPDVDGLEKILYTLPEPLRQAVLLYYLDGRSTHSVAQALGISADGVMTRLSRARRLLRERLSAEGETL
jgi:RNA polymerase sigma-70 factor (ECF subfamily)